eukprot:6938600-Alexandrium_andersonii.AAC.1
MGQEPWGAASCLAAPPVGARPASGAARPQAARSTPTEPEGAAAPQAAALRPRQPGPLGAAVVPSLEGTGFAGPGSHRTARRPPGEGAVGREHSQQVEARARRLQALLPAVLKQRR